jgi:uncharacterized alpha/beta hydrolase family protein
MPIKRSKKQKSLTYQVCLHKDRHATLIKFLEDQRENNRISNSALFTKALEYFKDQFDTENFNKKQEEFKESL